MGRLWVGSLGGRGAARVGELPVARGARVGKPPVARGEHGWTSHPWHGGSTGGRATRGTGSTGGRDARGTGEHGCKATRGTRGARVGEPPVARGMQLALWLHE